MRALRLFFIIVVGALASAAHAACVDIRDPQNLQFAGTLTYKIFAGPPNFEDVRKGDTPEPAYILLLDAPTCFFGDDFVEPDKLVNRVQLISLEGAAAQTYVEMRNLVGRRVWVVGKSAFGAHTAHHHAPVLVDVATVEILREPTDEYGTALTTVRAFYLALAAGNGAEAARMVIPERTYSGAFSAPEISRFYGSLTEPLRLIDIVPLGPNEFRVHYTFVAGANHRCQGDAIVYTMQRAGMNLISSIKALNGC